MLRPPISQIRASPFTKSPAVTQFFRIVCKSGSLTVPNLDDVIVQSGVTQLPKLVPVQTKKKLGTLGLSVVLSKCFTSPDGYNLFIRLLTNPLHSSFSSSCLLQLIISVNPYQICSCKILFVKFISRNFPQINVCC